MSFPSFKIDSKRRKPALSSGGSAGGGGQSQVASYQIAGQKAQQAQQQLPGAIPVSYTDPQSNVKFESQAGQDFDVTGVVRKQAAQDAFKLSQSYKFLESLENDYKEAYAGKNFKPGLEGGSQATGEYFKGVIARQNPALRRYVKNREASGVTMGRIGGDVGNFAWQEQESHLKRLPEAKPNFKLENLGLADDPEFGKGQFENIKSIYLSKLREAQEVARTGIVPENSSYSKPVQAQSGNARQRILDRLRNRGA